MEGEQAIHDSHIFENTDNSCPLGLLPLITGDISPFLHAMIQFFMTESKLYQTVMNSPNNNNIFKEVFAQMQQSNDITYQAQNLQNRLIEALNDSYSDTDEILAFLIIQSELIDLFKIFNDEEHESVFLYMNAVLKPDKDNLGDIIPKDKIFFKPDYLIFHNTMLADEMITKVPHRIEVPLSVRNKYLQYESLAVIYKDDNDNIFLLKRVGEQFFKFSKDKLINISCESFLNDAEEKWMYIIYKKDIEITKESGRFISINNNDKSNNRMITKTSYNYFFYVSVPRGKIKEEIQLEKKPSMLCRKLNCLTQETSSLIKHQMFDKQDILLQNIQLIKEKISQEPECYTEEMDHIEKIII